MEQAMQLLIQAQTSQAKGMATLQALLEQLAAGNATALPGASPASRLTKQTPGDNVAAYLEVFERVAAREGWPAAQWASIIAPFLTGGAQQAYQDLDPASALDYAKVKKAILEIHGYNLATRAQRFHVWEYKGGEPVRGQLAQLRRLARDWLVGGEGPALLDRVVIDKCVRNLPPEAQRWAIQKAPTKFDDLAELLEAYQVAQQMKGPGPPSTRGRETWPERQPRGGVGRPNPHTTGPRRAPAPPPRTDGKCYACGQEGHFARHCPVGGDVSMPTACTTEPAGTGRGFYAACLATGAAKEDRLPVKVGHHDTWALLDSGSHLSLVRPELVSGPPGNPVEVTCIHGDTRSYQTHGIVVRSPWGTCTLQAGVVPDLPVPLLLGRNCPLLETYWTERRRQPQTRTRPGRRRKMVACAAVEPPTDTTGEEPDEEGRRPTIRHASATETASERGRPAANRGDSASAATTPRPDPPANGDPDSSPLTALSDFPFANRDGTAREGRFATLQLEDDTLKHAWAQVKSHDGNPLDPVSPLTYPHFATRRNLLYRVARVEGHVVEQLMVPRPYVTQVLYMAHTHLLGAHLGMEKTRERIEARFYWTGLKRQVCDYCRECPECQRTAPRPFLRGPLVPLPILDTPFERLALDIVGPLPKSSRGHRYLLVMIDYATRYPEAIPLRAASSKAVARELMLLFSQVGIAKEILTDQGSCFMSRVFKDLMGLLQVKQLRTSVYHPQTDGLCERFNKTLKLMLKKVTEVDRKSWDQLVPHVLFAIREVPQASTGFSPFELLYGRRPRGLLDLAKEVWESQPSPHRTVIEHTESMKTRMAQIWPLVRTHLEQAQQAQARLYNRGARVRSFQPGEKVLVLIPSSDCKFLARWQGPYEIVKQIGEVNYVVRQPGRRKPTQVYHVNLLKKWHSSAVPQARPVFLTRPPPPEVPMGPMLGPSQKQDLMEMVLQHQDVFSELPGKTTVAVHDIRTEPGVTVRVRPYRIPEARRTAIQEEVEKMLKLGVIEESRSHWSSPIVLVPKPDGTYRFCNDFRQLNAASKFDAYPMPRADELIERFGPARFITTLDLTKGYWQVPLTRAAKEKTAFSTPNGLYQYTVLPFGVHGAPATFQRMMDRVLRPHQAYAAAYLDDIVIHSTTWEEHLAHLRAVLGALRRAGLTANPQKCHLGMEEASYLGYRVGRGNVWPQEPKLDAIKEWPRPTTKKQVKKFLGLVGYYQRFIPQYSTLAGPLHDLTKKLLPDRVRWTEATEGAFNLLRQALCSESVLVTPDFSQPFLVQTDASDIGVGAVLSQVRDGAEHPVTYISRKFLPHEKNYSTVEKEALAIKWAVEKLRYYLLGRKFDLVTDHAPLRWMATAKDTNARVTRWFLTLQDFNFRVIHRPGRENGNADALSRRDACLWAVRGAPSMDLGRGSCGDPGGRGTMWSAPRRAMRSHLQPSAATGGSAPRRATRPQSGGTHLTALSSLGPSGRSLPAATSLRVIPRSSRRGPNRPVGRSQRGETRATPLAELSKCMFLKTNPLTYVFMLSPKADVPERTLLFTRTADDGEDYYSC